MGKIANQRKVPKRLPFKNCKSNSQKYLMCIYNGHMCICVPNMGCVCLNLWLGEVCTDANADANTDDANDDARRTKHDCIKLFG